MDAYPSCFPDVMPKFFDTRCGSLCLVHPGTQPSAIYICLSVSVEKSPSGRATLGDPPTLATGQHSGSEFGFGYVENYRRTKS
ncbi:hypothetical protein E2C01_056495 [Portunus trituberculatus]|uniref:Uncharacterized protein n=1 Tax=Portunus trituberculatus TaxID=210409 RepID=A0A5B7GQS5_PORTR|nr:hypothetical protein [Portunus trituberculatus]